VVAALLQPDHYLVTPTPASPADDAAWLDALQRALADGPRRLQVRLTGMDPARRHALVAAAAGHCALAGAEMLVNGDVALARDLGLGLHLPAAQLRSLGERPVPASTSLAASCHDIEELRLAEALGCDFVVVGPVNATPSHPGVPGIGWPAFEALREHASLPIYAIGGLGPDDIPDYRQHGAQVIAAIRGLWPSPLRREHHPPSERPWARKAFPRRSAPWALCALPARTRAPMGRSYGVAKLR
jgi:8-oxo-dGTP diphosphatase